MESGEADKAQATKTEQVTQNKIKERKAVAGKKNCIHLQQRMANVVMQHFSSHHLCAFNMRAGEAYIRKTNVFELNKLK